MSGEIFGPYGVLSSLLGLICPNFVHRICQRRNFFSFKALLALVFPFLKLRWFVSPLLLRLEGGFFFPSRCLPWVAVNPLFLPSLEKFSSTNGSIVQTRTTGNTHSAPDLVLYIRFSPHEAVSSPNCKIVTLSRLKFDVSQTISPYQPPDFVSILLETFLSACILPLQEMPNPQ